MMYKKTALIFGFLSILILFEAFCEIDEHGFWYGDGILEEHRTDYALADGLAGFFVEENAHSVLDLGCGIGAYVKVFRYYGIDADGYDGNPDTEELSHGIAKVADLTEPLDLEKSYDWVLCLEVGEHIPKKFENILLDNIDKNNTKGVVLSWALKGQGGYGHVNEQNNDTIKAMMESRGYFNDIDAENRLRSKSSLWWFKKSLMVFRK